MHAIFVRIFLRNRHRRLRCPSSYTRERFIRRSTVTVDFRIRHTFLPAAFNAINNKFFLNRSCKYIGQSILISVESVLIGHDNISPQKRDGG